jgi:hypothetical protein
MLGSRFTFYVFSDETQFGTGKTDLSGNRLWIDNPDLVTCDFDLITFTPKRRLHRE